jgi:hypothetical protein
VLNKDRPYGQVKNDLLKNNSYLKNGQARAEFSADFSLCESRLNVICQVYFALKELF